jgi:hypothetical protein
LDTGAALSAANADGQSLESIVDGAPSAQGFHATGEHGGAAVHDVAAEHGHGVTAETSQVDPATQGTIDAAERAPASAPAAAQPDSSSPEAGS